MFEMGKVIERVKKELNYIPAEEHIYSRVCEFLAQFSDLKNEKQALHLLSVSSFYVLNPAVASAVKDRYAEMKKYPLLRKFAERYDPTQLIDTAQALLPVEFAEAWIKTKEYEKWAKRFLVGSYERAMKLK